MLTDIQTIINHHQKDHATKASRFNLFEVLRITSDEVRLHSRLLAELLDPKGSHDQGTILLDLFLDHCGCSTVFPDTSNVRVLVEHHLGSTTATSGGRIDLLLIDDRQNAVIIENKIFAGDQENQLLRYANFGNELVAGGGSYQLLYLTLHGTPASDKSKGKTLKEEDYSTIAYAQQIRHWLGDAITQFQHIPKLAVALEHYQQLIERLTGQHMNHALEREIAERIAQDGQSFETAVAIANTLSATKQRLLSQFGQELAKRITATFGGSQIEISNHFGSKWHGLELYNGESGDVENRNPHIRLSFLSDYSDCYIEIHPGLLNKESNDKNHAKRAKYVTFLSGYFSGSQAKIQNTEKHWQGEWVCRYFKLDNRFTDLIDRNEIVMNEVLADLEVVYKAFVRVEQGTLSRKISGLSVASIETFELEHNRLMDEIRIQMNDDENERYVISDGVHSPELYFDNPLRIAWMLKEPYDDENGIGGGWSLLDMFDDEDQYAKFSEGHRTTWHPIIYVTYALKNGFMKYGDMDYIRDDHSMIEVLKSTAFINAQKLPSKNVTTTHFNDLHESLEKYHDLLIRQINLVNPNVLIFANTLHVYRKYLGIEKLPLQPHGTLKYIFHEGKLYIDAYHPAQRTVKGLLYNDDIVTVVEKLYDQLV